MQASGPLAHAASAMQPSQPCPATAGRPLPQPGGACLQHTKALHQAAVAISACIALAAPSAMQPYFSPIMRDLSCSTLPVFTDAANLHPCPGHAHPVPLSSPQHSRWLLGTRMTATMLTCPGPPSHVDPAAPVHPTSTPCGLSSQAGSRAAHPEPPRMQLLLLWFLRKYPQQQMHAKCQDAHLPRCPNTCSSCFPPPPPKYPQQQMHAVC